MIISEINKSVIITTNTMSTRKTRITVVTISENDKTNGYKNNTQADK